MKSKKIIVVAMSGGVDSSTVAAMLHADGHDVIGVTLQLYDYGKFAGKKGACCAGQDIYDAQIAAEKIGIPHYVLNYETLFKQSVIDDFADSYIRGETPLPCVQCNQRVKFADLFKVAKELGAEKLATGHYVQKFVNNGIAELHKGHDISKDQSYFLFTITQKQLDFLEFPIGHLNKTETRKLAQQYGLNVADKPDSQDICFVPDGNYAKVVEKLRPEAFIPGNITLQNGTIIGQHAGIAHYTVGQRKGIGIAGTNPLYVIKIEPDTNQIIVGSKDELQETKLMIKDVNWLITPGTSQCCNVKLRSTHSGTPATVTPFDQNQDRYVVNLHTPYEAISPGQACVMYENTRIIGGGWIMRG